MSSDTSLVRRQSRTILAVAPPNGAVRNDSRGHRIVKEHKDSTRRIHGAVAEVTAFAAASTAAPGPQLFVFDDQDALVD